MFYTCVTGRTAGGVPLTHALSNPLLLSEAGDVGADGFSQPGLILPYIAGQRDFVGAVS